MLKTHIIAARNTYIYMHRLHRNNFCVPYKYPYNKFNEHGTAVIRAEESTVHN